MSDHPATDRRDQGMTLIELLISIVVLGTIITVIASAVIVTIRQQPETEARLDVARWEQSLALWLPTDLASATTVSADETATPCGSGACVYGSNALQLSWNDGTGETIVSYRYGPSSDGESYELHRVVCKAGSCSDQIVLRDLAVPAFNHLRQATENGDPAPLRAFHEAAARLVQPSIAAWTARWRTGPLREVERTGDLLRALAEADPDHLAEASVHRLPPPADERRLGCCGTLGTLLP